MCAIGQTMCDQSPLQSMRECREFNKIEDGLKEQKRLTRNDQARKRYHARNKIK